MSDFIITRDVRRMSIGPVKLDLQLTLPESARPLNLAIPTSFNVENNLSGSGTIALSFDDAIAILNWLNLHGIRQ